MSDHHHHRTSDNESRVSADRGALLATIVHLWPYIWPSDRRDLKLRVIGSLILLLVAKLATIAVPFTYKWATDALAGQGTAPVAASNWLLWAMAAPIAMTIAKRATLPEIIVNFMRLSQMFAPTRIRK